MPARDTDNFLWPSLGIVAALFILSLLAVELGTAAPVLVVFWGPALLYVLFKAPPHTAARVLFLAGLVLESPDERPGGGYWTPPFVPASEILYGGMKNWTGIPGLSFPLFLPLALMLYLRARKSRPTATAPRPPAEAVKALQVYGMSLAGFWVWGMLRGGVVQPSFWQLIQLICMWACALAFLYSFRGHADVRAVGTIVLVAAVVKGLQVMWVYEVVMGNTDEKPFYATTHSDSATFATAVLILCTMLFQERTWKNLRRLLLGVPFVVTAIVMNNRRLAFVGIGFGFMTSFAMMRPGPAKRRIIRVLLLMTPVFIVYFLIGAKSESPIFMPARLIDSVLSGSDSSSITRDIENYNLMLTLKSSRILGTGFGHEYIEAIKADDISGGHPLYLYIPHNSLLWIWSAVGVVGMALLWLIYPLMGFFAARAYRRGGSSIDMAACLTALGVLMTVMSMHWGDMGLHSYPTLLLFSAAYAIAAKLCVAAEGEPAQRVTAKGKRF